MNINVYNRARKMDESLLSEFEHLKISALSKLKFVIKTDIGHVTLGPNSVQNQKPKVLIDKSLQKNTTTTTAATTTTATTTTATTTTQVTIKQNSSNDIQKLLINNETKRLKEVRNIVQVHIDNLENFSKLNQMYHQQQWRVAQEEFINYQREKDKKIIEANDEFDRTVSIERARTEKRYKDLEEQRKLREQELKEAEERKKILHLNIEKIQTYHQEFYMEYQTITALIQNCPNKEKLRENLGDAYEELKNLPNQIEEIRLKCQNSSVTEEDVNKGADIVTSIKGISNQIKEIVDRINENKDTAPTVPEDITSTVSTQHVPEPTIEPNSFNENERSQSDNTFIMSKYISANNFMYYCEIIKFLESHFTSFQELEQDISQKQFRFDCKKAVNIPVNALSGVSSEHILDKYNRLYNLLRGYNVEVNSQLFNASNHPQGIAFCMDLLAKKLVLQGDLMVSGNPESAFCYASLIVSLWNAIPSFGKLVLAYFYSLCPYLVPYYIPKEDGQSDEQFYRQCGYHYIDGQIESQDKFLKRITGIARLYFTLLIAKPKHGQNQVPHNLTHGWRWLTSILKLEPRVDVTATLLHTFLETLGFEMEMKYGRMFLKVLEIIGGQFLQICKGKCTGGAGTRLELLLNEYIQKRKFSPPPGYTSVSTW